MTPEQYREARAILENDCESQREYLNDDGKTCAIGALALASGITRQGLRRGNSKGIHERPSLAKAIARRFGLSLQAQEWLQAENDRSIVWRSGQVFLASLSERRAAVIEALDDAWSMTHEEEPPK